MGFLGRLFTTFGGRIAGAVAACLSTQIAENTGVIVDPAALITLGISTYALVHRLTSKKTNPVDAASSTVAHNVERSPLGKK